MLDQIAELNAASALQLSAMNAEVQSEKDKHSLIAKEKKVGSSTSFSSTSFYSILSSWIALCTNNRLWRCTPCGNKA